MKQLDGKEIVIIAGPSASGKSHLLQQLMTKKTNTCLLYTSDAADE